MVTGGVVLNIEKGQWHSLKCLESGTVLLEAKDGGIGRWRRMRFGNEVFICHFCSCSFVPQRRPKEED